MTVRLVKTKVNEQKFVAAIFQLDKMLTGDFAGSSKNGFLIIGDLIKAMLKKPTNGKLTQYTLDCFRSFCRNKKQIILDMHRLYEYGDRKINALIFYSLNAKEDKKKSQSKMNHDVLDNFPRPEMLSLFPNVTSLTIQNEDLKHAFPVSLSALPNIICGTNLSTVIIKAVADTETDYCWMTHSQISPREIKQVYDTKSYDVSLKEVIKDNTEYWFIIKKRIK